MLRQLKISNFAIIDSVEIDFERGLTTITGETGAGKSIILGAMSLILGDKADVKTVGNPDAKTVVEATFGVSGYGLETLLTQNDIDDFGSECILRREISVSGRSRAFINDTPVTLTVMRSVAMRLIDIHSQHSNLLLSRHSYQLSIVDSLLPDNSILERYASEYTTYKRLSGELSRIVEQSQKDRADEAYLRYQQREFMEMALESGEDVSLLADERKLSNVNDIKTALWTASELLNGDDRSVVGDVASAVQALRRIDGIYSEAGQLAERLESALIDLKDISHSLVVEQGGLADDPVALERVQSRLSSIYTLEQKHHVDSVDQLIEIQQDINRRLASIVDNDEQIATLREELERQTVATMSLAKDLSKARHEAAQEFSAELIAAAKPLAMGNLQFEVNFEETSLSPTGIDSVSFMASFNRQQPLTPVEATASGGEISRLMLCIKSIIARSMCLPTVVLDEVDTGVSGETANRMGEMMRQMGERIQIIAITHLPQVAVKGSSQMKVYKSDTADATHTAIRRLSSDERVIEIASMLSGEAVDQAAIDNARSLLGL